MVTVPSLRSTQIDTDVSVVLQTSDGVSSNSYHFRTSNNAGEGALFYSTYIFYFASMASVTNRERNKRSK